MIDLSKSTLSVTGSFGVCGRGYRFGDVAVG